MATAKRSNRRVKISVLTIATRFTFLFLFWCTPTASAHIVFPVCSLEYLTEQSSHIVIGSVTPGTPTDRHSPPFDHIVITQVFKGDLKPAQQIEVPEVLSQFPSHWTLWIPKRLPFQPDSVLLFLVDRNPWHPDSKPPDGAYFQMVGGGPCLFSGDRAYACFQAMNPPPDRPQNEQSRSLDTWPPGSVNAPSNPPDLSKQQILQQLDAALHPTAERLAILGGDPDDPTLVQARCEFVKQRRAMFRHVAWLQDGSAQRASDRIGRIKPFEQLDALVMGPDVALGDAVPIDIYLASDIGRRRLVEHLVDSKLSDHRFGSMTLDLADNVARKYLAYHEGTRPGDALAAYPLLTQLAEVAARPNQTISNRAVLLNRLEIIRDDLQQDPVHIDPACQPDIASAINVLDNASNEPARHPNERQEFKRAADHLRPFQGGFIPGNNRATSVLPIVKIHLAETLLRLIP